MKKKKNASYYDGLIEDITLHNSAIDIDDEKWHLLSGTYTGSSGSDSLTEDKLLKAVNTLTTVSGSMSTVGLGPVDNWYNVLRTDRAYFAVYMCDDCGNAAFYIIKKMHEGEIVEAESLLTLDGLTPSLGNIDYFMECGSCGIKIDSPKMSRLIIVRDEERDAVIVHDGWSLNT